MILKTKIFVLKKSLTFALKMYTSIICLQLFVIVFTMATTAQQHFQNGLDKYVIIFVKYTSNYFLCEVVCKNRNFLNTHTTSLVLRLENHTSLKRLKFTIN